MKLKEALEVLKDVGYNITLAEAQFTDRVMQDAMEDDQFIKSDELEAQEAAMDAVDVGPDGEYQTQVSNLFDQFIEIRNTATELIRDNDNFMKLDSKDQQDLCSLVAKSTEAASILYNALLNGETDLEKYLK